MKPRTVRRARPSATRPGWERRRSPAPTQPKRDWITLAVVAFAGLPGLAPLVALIFTYQSVNATNVQLQIAEQGQITDRYNAAITNLGPRSIEVRLGGIYALQRLMQDSPRDQPTVVAVLCAFVRDQTASTATSRTPPGTHLPTDTQAALTVVGTRNTAYDGRTTVVDLNHAQLSDAQLDFLQLSGANLSDASLTGADLSGAHLDGAVLDGAVLDGAVLTDADLRGAALGGAHLVGTSLTGASLGGAALSTADLTGAGLQEANLQNAGLQGADLTSASLTGSDLRSADLQGANLQGANLQGAHLTDAVLFGANLTDARLAGAVFFGADLEDAQWPKALPVPQGWVRDPVSGQLKGA